MLDVKSMPKLGFGLMRLPLKEEAVDVPQVCSMVDAYMEAGLNYFDTAYVYHGGKSEVVLGEALVKRYPREAYMVATKLPIWEVKEEADLDRIFEEQCERAGLSYWDFYLLHSIEDANVEKYEKFDAFSWGVKKREEGKIRHFGFSFHGSPELLKRLLNEHPEVEFVQIQLNYLDWENQVVQSGKLYEILREKNIPMIIMEPVKGGTLASLKPELEERYRALRPESSMASWAFRFVGSLPGVMTILSGMSSKEQMEDNLATFKNFEPLSEEEKALVEEVSRVLLNTPTIGCTSCRYCVDGCPMGIAIPDVFRAVNTRRVYGDVFRPQNFYNGLVEVGHGRASDCVACGQCEGVCPQHLPIIELMQEAAGMFDQKQ